MKYLMLLLTATLLTIGALASPAAATPAEEALIAPIEDWGCHDAHPVVLIHGTGNNAQTWAPMVTALHQAGKCVFAPNYGDSGFGLLGVYATAPVRDSARWLAGYVDRVLASTGAQKVSIVGHSQGGLMPRYYLRFLGGAAKVDDMIGLAPSNHGTTNPLAPVVGLLCPACQDQIAGSPFMQELNAGRDVEPGVDYTVVATAYDEVVIPYPSQFLAGPAAQVTNVTLQDACPLDLAEHVTVILDPAVWQWTLNALNRKGPAAAGFHPRCA